MEKDKRKKALQVACTVFVFVCVIFAMYKLTKLDEKNAIQRQKQEEMQEKEDKINAKCEAIEYMDEYTENLQEQMRKAGIGDIRVTYKKCSRDYFDEYWGIDEYDPSDYFYYFILDYYSDSIDSIYAENTSNGDFEPFIKLMNDVRLVKDNREGIYEYAQEIQMGDKWIAVNIKRPKMFAKVKRFFMSKFNTTKQIHKNIIVPLNDLVKKFRETELVNVKG